MSLLHIQAITKCSKYSCGCNLNPVFCAQCYDFSLLITIALT